MNNENENENEQIVKIESIQEEEVTKLPMIKRVSEYISKHDYMFRICIVGDANVGKTSLLTRYCDNTFKETYNNTIGVDFRVVTLQHNNTFSKIHIWDTAGQERFKSISVNYFRSAHGFMFVYDVTNKMSFQNLGGWVDLAFSSSKSSVVNFLVGNKIDLEGNRQVTVDEGKDLANLRKFNFLETSAKSNQNVDKAFEFFAAKLVENYSRNKKDYESLLSKGGDEKLKFDEISSSLDIIKKKKKCAC